MDSKTIGLAVSASALGAALAYLGYQNYEDKPEEADKEEMKDGEEMKEMDKMKEKATQPEDVTNKIVSTTNTEIKFNNENELETDEIKVKNEVKSALDKITWGEFWQGEYHKVDKKASVKPGINAEGFN